EVRLPAQLVGDHRRLRGKRGNDGDPAPLPLNRLDQRAEVAVAREEHQMIDVLGHLHGVDGELNVHIALDLPAAGGVDEFLRRLGDDGVTVVVEPVDQRTYGRIFLILCQRGVVISAEQVAFALKFSKKAFVIYVEGQRLCCRVQVCTINEEGDLLSGIEYHI